MMIEVTLNLLGQAPTQGALRDDYVDDVVLMVTAFLDAKAAQGKKSG